MIPSWISRTGNSCASGWIDSTCKKMPDGRFAQRLSPRRKGSNWTDLNKQRCADLELRGLMTAAGRKVLGEGVQ